MILIAATGGAIALAALLKYNVAVRATATVRPSGEVRVVQSTLEGTVESIAIEVNQPVQRGDIIAQLDRTPLETQKNQLVGSIEQSQLQLNQMNAQVQLLEAQIASEAQSIDQSVAVAQAELSRDQQQFREQQVTAQANLTEAQAALELAQSEMQRYQQLAETGAVSELQLEEKQAAVRTAEAQVQRAQTSLNPTQAPVAIAQERISQERSRGTATLANLNREQESLVQRRSEIQAQLIREQQDLQRIENQLQNSVIRATSDGVVLRLNLRNPNQVVNAGETIAEIAPGDSMLIIKARVATQDIDHVQVGQITQLRVNACPYPDYGTLRGTVAAVSPDIVVSAEDLAERYFEVTIQPETHSLTNGDRECQLQSGMEAEASIISRQETFLQFLLRKARLLSSL
ncbi:MAG: HlyD family type I secretion periplasmic adaptor subunit [Elainellaceae cyanobacterium]